MVSPVVLVAPPNHVPTPSRLSPMLSVQTTQQNAINPFDEDDINSNSNKNPFEDYYDESKNPFADDI